MIYQNVYLIRLQAFYLTIPLNDVPIPQLSYVSAKMLLAEYGDDIDIFEPADIPDGVEMLAWGMKRITEPLKGKVVEIGMDATCEEYLELYSIMGEYDNAGFPMTYCLLSTATAIDIGKRKKAIAAWLRCLRDKYGVTPVFIHSDKDMGEIGTVQEVWEAKINLCWWHLWRAVRTRLAKAKLSTSPYNLNRAMAEYNFVKPDFVPAGTRVDVDDYEGGLLDDTLPPLVEDKSPPSTEEACTTQPADPTCPEPPLTQQQPQPSSLGDATNLLRIRLPLLNIASAIGRSIQGVGFKLSIPATRLLSSSLSRANHQLDGTALLCPSVNSRTLPSRCETEVWVYLWENWYRAGHWELWA